MNPNSGPDAPSGSAAPSGSGAGSDSGAATELVALRKVYRAAHGEVTAVDGISLRVEAGTTMGLLGPNGAGKTTTVGMLTTRVKPTSGHATVAGIDVARDPVGVRRRIGVVPQYNTLDRQLTVAENLEFRGRYTGLPVREARRRATGLLELFHLEAQADAQVQKLSGGQAQRVMIARALLHSPQILFLDEPTSGLDPQTRVNLWEALRQLSAAGHTVILTTHYLEEAEILCDRVAIVDHGRLLACDTPERLKERSGGESVVAVRYDGPAGRALAALDGAEVVAHSALMVTTASGRALEVDGDRLIGRTREPELLLSMLVRAGFDAGLAVRDAHVTRPSLETVFLSLTGREYRE
ncbi:MAG: ATP-binding cassette domain-containing protein [Actinocrinis sp.]